MKKKEIQFWEEEYKKLLIRKENLDKIAESDTDMSEQEAQYILNQLDRILPPFKASQKYYELRVDYPSRSTAGIILTLNSFVADIFSKAADRASSKKQLELKMIAAIQYLIVKGLEKKYKMILLNDSKGWD